MRKLLFLIAVTTVLSSCSWLYPSIMLKTPKDYQFTQLTDSTSSLEYKISVNDFVSMRLYTNDGAKLVDFTNVADNAAPGGGGGGGASYGTSYGIEYLVEADGTINFPVIGKTLVSGLTTRQTIRMLQEKYSQYYISPYIVMRVTNRRVIVFPGDPGTARVIPLFNNNTTVIEALALAGGITTDGKARQVKLIRGSPDKPQVYLLDLSTIDGIKAGSTVLQANDVIYVTPQRRPGAILIERIAPTLSLLTSALLVYSVFKGFKL